MFAEWGTTAAAGYFSGGAGLAAKPAIGFLAGAADEATYQYIANRMEQEWPHHPENS